MQSLILLGLRLACGLVQVSKGSTSSTLGLMGSLQRLVLWQLAANDTRMSQADAAAKLSGVCAAFSC